MNYFTILLYEKMMNINTFSYSGFDSTDTQNALIVILGMDTVENFTILIFCFSVNHER